MRQFLVTALFSVSSACRPLKISSVRLCKIPHLLGMTAALLAFSSPLAAQTTYTWDAGGANTSWGTAANWVGDAVPTFDTNAILVFNTNVGTSDTLFLGAQRQISGIIFGTNLTGGADNVFDIQTRTTLGGATGANLLLNGGAANASITLDANTILSRVRLGAGGVGAISLQTTTDLFHNASGVVLQFDANTTGAGALNKHGVGAVTFTRSNSFNGLNLYGGTVVAWSSVTAMGTNSVTLGQTGSSSNVSLFLGSSNTYTNAITVSSGSGTRLIGNTDVTNQFTGLGLGAITGNAILSGGMTLNTNVTFAITNYVATTTDRMTVSGAITGTGGIIKTGTGFLQLSGANTYSGDTVLEGGNIQTTASNSFSSASLLKFGATANNRRLQLQGSSQTLGGVDSTAATGGTLIVEAAGDNVSNAPATLTLNVAAGQSHNFSGIVRNAAGTATNSALTLVKDGAGTQVLSGGANVSYSGTTTVNAGVLEFGGTNTVANNSAITLGSNGTVRFSGGGTRSSTIAGSGNLEKTGANTLTLGGANAYTGATTIGGGTLLVATNGSIASSSLATVNSGGLLQVNGTAGAITVNNGGSLGGSGSVGAVTLTTGSHLKPGNSPGLLTASAATWAAGSTYQWEINNATGTAGINWDVFSVSGALDLSALSSSGQMDLVLQSLSIENYNTSTSYTWVIAKASSFTGVGAGETDLTSLFNINSAAFNGGAEANLPNGGFKVVTGTDGSLRTLNLMAIPEPSTGSMMALGLAGLVVTRLLRRKSS
jgi:autotransporter-associated beta strand protein